MIHKSLMHKTLGVVSGSLPSAGRRVLGTAMAAWLSCGVLTASSDFSGRWTIDAKTRDEMAALAGTPTTPGIDNESLTVKQDARTLTVTRKSSTVETSVVYQLDGAESRNTNSSSGAIEVSKAVWVGDELRIETRRSGGVAAVTTQVWTLARRGLAIATTVASRPGAPPQKTTEYFRKAL